MIFVSKQKLLDAQRELELAKRDRDIADYHRDTLLAAKEELKEEIRSLENQLSAERLEVQRQKSIAGNVQQQLEYEKNNRNVLIDAEVSRKCGEYEVQYHHDMHEFLEKHHDKFHDFQQSFMTKTLDALKELKPVEPKVYIMDKSGAAPVGGNKDKQKQE